MKINLNNYNRCINCAIEVQELISDVDNYNPEKLDELRDIFDYHYKLLKPVESSSIDTIVRHLSSISEYYIFYNK